MAGGRCSVLGTVLAEPLTPSPLAPSYRLATHHRKVRVTILPCRGIDAPQRSSSARRPALCARLDVSRVPSRIVTTYSPWT